MSLHTEGAREGESGERRRSIWRNRNFLRFFAGQFVTNAGDSLYSVAVMWLVYDLSGSTLLTGLASSLLLLPFLLQAIAGPVVDRFRIKPVLVGTQVVQGVVVLVFPVAAYTGTLTVELVIAVIPVLSLVSLVSDPIPTALLPRILDEDQLSEGNSALSTITIGLDMVFDALGGLFVAVFGATTLFMLDSVTFATATMLFAGMTIPAVNVGDDTDGDGGDGTLRAAASTYLADMRAGLDALRGTVFVEMVAVGAVVNFAIGVTLGILPAFGALRGGATTYGLLLGALGVGRLLGSVVASRLTHVPYGRFKAVTFVASALLWLGAVYAPTTALTVALFCLAWVSPGVAGVLVSTINQTVFPTELLGRVSALKGTASTATLPVGSLVGGAVAQHVGTVPTMALAASGFGFAGLYFAARSPLRRLPAVDDADPAAFGVDLNSDSADADDD